MATEQTQPVEIADTEPHDYIFHLPDRRASEFTFWLDNIAPDGLTLAVLLKRVGDEALLREFEVGEGKLFELVGSSDGKSAFLRNSNALYGVSDIGLRLTYSAAPSGIGWVTFIAYADAGKL